MAPPYVPRSTTTSSSSTNGLGVAGFVCSMVGLLCTGGIVSPVGLILSLVALGRPPRGLAIAGAIIGAIGSCGIIALAITAPVVVLVALAAVGASAAAGGLAAMFGPQIETQVELAVLDMRLQRYEQQNGKLPASLAEVSTSTDPSRPDITDPWGNPYQYVPVPTAAGRPFRLFSMGEDAVSGTPDDIEGGQFTRIPQRGTTPPASSPAPPVSPAREQPAPSETAPDEAEPTEPEESAEPESTEPESAPTEAPG